MSIYVMVYSFLLFISILVMWFAGDLSVKYSIQTAKKFHFSTLFVGFVLISISTGLPELSIVVSSILENAHSLSAGTILGSNVCDISLVLGIAILLGQNIQIEPKEGKDSLLMLAVTTIATLIVFILGVLTKLAGLFLIVLYFVSIWWLWKNSTKKEIKEEEKIQKEAIANNDTFFKRKWGIVLKLLASIFALLIASEFVVRFALKLTYMMKLSLATVGATILAIGTSLPEIVLAMSAVKKREYALALGNSLGSVLEQGTLLVGLLALGANKPVDITGLRSLLPFMLVSFGIISFGIIVRKKLTKIEGLLMFSVFIVFMIYHLRWIG